jgi:DNA-directed RNA polymerase subunit RPC12/RpoP
MTRVSGYICKDCGEPFSMEKKEIEFYENKGWEQPKRCPGCRKKRREYRVNCLGVIDPRD